jgi:hypothetical protein
VSTPFGRWLRFPRVPVQGGAGSTVKSQEQASCQLREGSARNRHATRKSAYRSLVGRLVSKLKKFSGGTRLRNHFSTNPRVERLPVTLCVHTGDGFRHSLRLRSATRRQVDGKAQATPFPARERTRFALRAERLVRTTCRRLRSTDVAGTRPRSSRSRRAPACADARPIERRIQSKRDPGRNDGQTRRGDLQGRSSLCDRPAPAGREPRSRLGRGSRGRSRLVRGSVRPQAFQKAAV